MTVDEELDNEIFDEGIIYDEYAIPHFPGEYYFCREVGAPIIGIDPAKVTDTYQKNFEKGHELGHHHTLECDLLSAKRDKRRRSEYRANRWATLRLMAPSKIIEAFEKEGCWGIISMADYLNIPIEKFCKGIEILHGIYGQQIIKGQYIISLNPFSIKKDSRRKAV